MINLALVQTLNSLTLKFPMESFIADWTAYWDEESLWLNYLKVSQFVFLLRYYVHFQTNILDYVMS